MKVSMDGKLLDPQLEEGKLIIEAIFDILRGEWRSIMKEEFVSQRMAYTAIFIFFYLRLVDEPSKEELTDYLYTQEVEKGSSEPSRIRCETLVDQILSLMFWVRRNKTWTDDPGFARYTA